MSNLQLAILGPFVLTEDGQPVELNIAKLQALLGYLALTGRALPREQLLGLLWAESHPDAARKNLRNRLWQLRQVTKGELIVTTGEQLALAANVQCDILRFTATLERELRVARPDLTALATSVDLWRGPLLDGLQLQEAPDFELWLSQQRERLRQLYLQAVDQLITYAQSQRKWQHTVGLAQKALAHDPLHEPLYQQLMTGYAQLGQRAEALQQYTRLHELLAAELAVAPLPATELLRDQIALGFLPAPPIALPPDQSAGKSEPREQTQPTQAIAGQTDLLQTANKLLPHKNVHPFIGRQKQLAALTQALQESRQGSRVVLLSGELGMGKSTLWQQWVSLLRVDEPGAVVLATRCLNTTQSMPFEPMQRLLST
ncbi:MAG: AAA family ATPase, partial [Caldilineaceae bacterium]|nr:AAA family ATPase [Caldilineaceae bacterium]